MALEAFIFDVLGNTGRGEMMHQNIAQNITIHEFNWILKIVKVRKMLIAF